MRNQCRKWQVTINNPDNFGYTHEKIKLILSGIKNLDYWCMCDEIGNKTHTYHIHLFFYRRKSPFTFKQIKKMFPEPHIESAEGTCKENRDYIRKEGKYENSNKTETNLKNTFEEMGECPVEEQGKRTDLEDLYDMIKDGMTNYQILEENPNYIKQLDKLDRVREITRYEEYRNKLRDVWVEYWYGKAGAGKTSGVLNRYGYENVYRVTDMKNPWDSYRGQDVVLFDDFIGDVEITKLLIWLDRYPLELPCRYNNKTACYTKVFFTSNKSLDSLYMWIQLQEPETWNALMRRINCVKVFGDNGLEEYYNINDYLKRYENNRGFMQVSQAEQMKIDELFGRI